MLLVCDIGNTNITFAIFNDNQIILRFTYSTDLKKTSDELGIFLFNIFAYNKLSFSDIKNIAVSSVVPEIEYDLSECFKKYFNIIPFFITYKAAFNINNLYEFPNQLGIDRLINASYSYFVYKKNLIVIDFGTATTFDVVFNGNYEGGVIIPGIKTLRNTLFEKTNKLPKVDLILPPSVIGKNTIHSIQSGLFYGYAGMTEGLVNQIKNNYQQEFLVISTGGLSSIINKIVKCIDYYDDNLILKGIEYIYTLNRGNYEF